MIPMIPLIVTAAVSLALAPPPEDVLLLDVSILEGTNRFAMVDALATRSGSWVVVQGDEQTRARIAQQIEAIAIGTTAAVDLSFKVYEVPAESRFLKGDLMAAPEAALIAAPRILLQVGRTGTIVIENEDSDTHLLIEAMAESTQSISLTVKGVVGDAVHRLNRERVPLPNGRWVGFSCVPPDEDATTRLVVQFDGLAMSSPDPAPNAGRLTPIHTIYKMIPKSRDGIGKTFVGREIAHVMGHLAAGWLERPEREQEERTDRLVGMLPLNDDSIIADIGAGSGYFTSRLAPRVPKGKILATDIQPEMLQLLGKRVTGEGLTNVETILGTVTDTGLGKESVDLILLVDVYHEFDHPWEMLRSMHQALKPGGRVAIAEYRANDPTVPIKPLHTMTAEQVRLEFELAGFTLEAVKTDLPRQRLFLFKRS